MNAQVQKLVDLILAGKVDEAKEVAASLQPPEHKQELYQKWLATYSGVMGVIFEDGYEKQEEYSIAINFMRQVGTPDKYDLNKVFNFINMFNDASSAECKLMTLYAVRYMLDFTQKVLLPHLQDLHLYPVAEDAFDSSTI